MTTPPRVLLMVENVSLALPRASVTAVVGESGSGKSTLARMLARIITPTSGQLLLDGKETPTGQRHRQEDCDGGSFHPEGRPNTPR